MRTVRDIAILTALMAAATWLLGWWMVPVIAALTTLWHRRPGAGVIQVTLAALLAWGSLLVLQGVVGGSVRALSRDLGVSLGVPAAVPLVLTLVLPALLAASAAGVVAALRRERPRQLADRRP